MLGEMTHKSNPEMVLDFLKFKRAKPERREIQSLTSGGVSCLGTLGYTFLSGSPGLGPCNTRCRRHSFEQGQPTYR